MIKWSLIVIMTTGLLFSGCAGCSKSGRAKLKMERENPGVPDRKAAPAEAEEEAPPVVRPPSSPDSRREFQSIPNILAKAEPAVFIIHTLDRTGAAISQGTGFFIKENGVGLSNYHVFEGGSSWIIQTVDGKKYEVNEVLETSQEFDFILFRVRSSAQRFPSLKLAALTPGKGEDILVLGNPQGLESTVTRGIVSSIRPLDGLDDLIQIDAAISPGSSGSPVLNMYGEAVGYATLQIEDCENCNFAFNIKIVDRFNF